MTVPVKKGGGAMELNPIGVIHSPLKDRKELIERDRKKLKVKGLDALGWNTLKEAVKNYSEFEKCNPEKHETKT